MVSAERVNSLLARGVRPGDLPAWGEIALVALLATTTVSVLAGLGLGLLGLFAPWPILIIAACSGALVIALWRPETGPERMSHPWFFAAVALAAIVAVFHIAHHGEHLVVDRDPGVYATTGLWLADGDSQVIDTELELFGETGDLNSGSLGYSPLEGGSELAPQFPHGFPVLLGVAAGTTKDKAAFVVNPLLVGLAMLCIFAVAARLVGPLSGLAASAAVGLNPAVAFFGRDTYSEIASLVLVWGGLWLTARSWGNARVLAPLLAGAVLGTAVSVRLDAAVVLPAFVLAVGAAVTLARLSSIRRGASVRNTVLVGVGAAGAVAFSLYEAAVASPPYYAGLEERILRLVWLSVALAVVGTFVAWLMPALVRRLKVTMPRWARLWIPAAAGVGLLGAAAFAWFIRPHVQKTLYPDIEFGARGLIEFLQRRANADEINGRRSYGENTMLWLEWYMGPLALAAGIIGLALAVFFAIRGHRRGELSLYLLPVIATGILYVVDPRITPDLIWAMRRFVPLVVPGLLVAAVGLAAVLILVAPRTRAPALLRGGGLALMIAIPLWQAIDVADERIREHHGSYAGVLQLCKEIGPEPSAVVIVPSTSSLGTFAAKIHSHFSPAVRAVCDVPTQRTTKPITASLARQLSDDVSDSGRRLVVLSATPEVFGAGTPRVGTTRLATEFAYQRLRFEIERPELPDGRTVRVWRTEFPEGLGFVTDYTQGFHRPESEGDQTWRWTRPGEPRFRIQLPRSGAATMEMKMASLAIERRVEVVVGPRTVARFQVTPGEARTYVARFDAEAGEHPVRLRITPGPERISEVLGTADGRSVAIEIFEPTTVRVD